MEDLRGNDQNKKICGHHLDTLMHIPFRPFFDVCMGYNVIVCDIKTY